MPYIEFKSTARPKGVAKTFVVPKFGKACICCGENAIGCTRPYDASSEHVTAETVLVPVCQDCHSHALTPRNKATDQLFLMMAGGGAALVGYLQLSRASFFKFLLAAGLLAMASSLLWFMWKHKERQRQQRRGHHTGFMMTLDAGYPIVHTDSFALADTLVELNPGAERKLFFRERRRFPKARAVLKQPKR